jgi:hypothetical protein
MQFYSLVNQGMTFLEKCKCTSVCCTPYSIFVRRCQHYTAAMSSVCNVPTYLLACINVHRITNSRAAHHMDIVMLPQVVAMTASCNTTERWVLPLPACATMLVCIKPGQPPCQQNVSPIVMLLNFTLQCPIFRQPPPRGTLPCGVIVVCWTTVPSIAVRDLHPSGVWQAAAFHSGATNGSQPTRTVNARHRGLLTRGQPVPPTASGVPPIQHNRPAPGNHLFTDPQATPGHTRSFAGPHRSPTTAKHTAPQFPQWMVLTCTGL